MALKQQCNILQLTEMQNIYLAIKKSPQSTSYILGLGDKTKYYNTFHEIAWQMRTKMKNSNILHVFGSVGLRVGPGGR